MVEEECKFNKSWPISNALREEAVLEWNYITVASCDSSKDRVSLSERVRGWQQGSCDTELKCFNQRIHCIFFTLMIRSLRQFSFSLEPYTFTLS
jgi:hypothetical protein